MNTKKLILPGLLSAITLGSIFIASNSVFADDVETTGTNIEQKDFSGHMMKGVNGIDQYIDVSSLSGDNQTTYQTALQTYQQSMKEMMIQARESSGDNTTMQDNMKTAWTTFMTSVRPLVSSDKLTDFDAFVAKGPQMMMGNRYGSGDHQMMGTGDHNFGSGDHNFGTGNQNWKGNHEKRNNTGDNQTQVSSTTSFKYIKGATYTQIQTILDKLTTDQLNTLITKIDNVISNLDSSTTNYTIKLAIYNELKLMVQNKLGISTSVDVSSEISSILE